MSFRPQAVICAVCGKEIAAYENRWYGDTGAVHGWLNHEPPQCKTKENAARYPNYYTDG